MDTAPQLSLSDILRSADDFLSPLDHQRRHSIRNKNALLAAEAEWRAAIAALEHLIMRLPRPTAAVTGADNPSHGIILAGPLPVFNQTDVGQQFETWVATPQPLAEALNGRRFLPPAAIDTPHPLPAQAIQALPLNLQNPLLTERFCIVITPTFSAGLVLGQPVGDSPCLQYSFDPQVLLTLWRQVRSHIADTAADKLTSLDRKLSRLIATPDYRLVTQFTQLLLAHLPHRHQDSALVVEEQGNVRLANWSTAPRDLIDVDAASPPHTEAAQPDLEETVLFERGQDTELLQAMAHEIRTPLTTIRTLTRSLMRRKDLPAEVHKRLARIDQECTQQIDRFNLIFRAVELETTPRDRPRSSLTPIALTHIFQDSIPRWQQQAHRRNLSLDVALPPDLPRVTSDPTLLNQVLTGVVEWFTQYLPAQSHIQMRVMLAGHQLKLQFEAEPKAIACPLKGKESVRQPLKSLGQLLMVAPETGGLSLNLNVTKNLFQFLGGKLTIRQRPKQGEVLTVFLPLDTREV